MSSYWQLSLLLAALSGLAAARDQAPRHPFVPACIVEHCYHEAMALGGDNYTAALGTCAFEGLSPCGSKAWDCLGDEACRSVLTCGPQVIKTCGEDIWKMLTQPSEREKLECLAHCMKDGKVDPLCAAAKCSKSAASCLFDATCREILECPAKATLSCSKPAFDCVFGKDPVCRGNVGCLAHGLVDCWAPVVNMGTDANIAKFMTCAGNSCPKPSAPPAPAHEESQDGISSLLIGAPKNTAEQLLCVSEKCGMDVLKAVATEDAKELLLCASQNRMRQMCSSAWDCLGDEHCSQSLKCWAKPLETCTSDLWHMLIDGTERSRIEKTARCIGSCSARNYTDMVDHTFCVLDNCGEDVLGCSRDPACRATLKCVPDMLGECGVPLAEEYLHDMKLQGATKCLAYGMEACGRSAVELLRNPQIAQAFQCASQCTRDPKDTLPAVPPSTGSSRTVVI